jgi:hypothetical protein
MRRCLVIGSSTYDQDDLDELPGAKSDADSVYAVLIDPQYGAYDSSSVKLIDPTLEEVRDALAKFVLSDPPLDVFSFYFAGHGDVSGGSFYMLLRSSKRGQLSRTALGITELFSLVNEGQPQQVNIVIDACRAGGVVFDLSQAIKAESLGAHISPNISLLAAADIVQGAEETDEGGIATTALVRALRGDDATPSTAPCLDLVTLGTHVAARMAEAGAAQAPIAWGLNLTGLSRFAINPHAAKSVVPLIGTMTGTAPSSPIAQRLEGRRDRLWRTYLDLGQGVDLGALSSELETAIGLLDAEAGQTSDFILGLSYSLPPRARVSGEPFADAEVLAACAACLVEVSKKDFKAAAAIEDIARRFVSVVDAEMAALDQPLRNNWRALLSRRGGYGDFILLPLRISRLLGYMAAVEIVAQTYGLVRKSAEAAAASITQRLAAEFDASFVCLSDQQSAYLSVFFSSPLSVRHQPETEQIFGLMFSDFITRGGRILATEFSGSSAFQYCWALTTETPMPTTVPLAVPTTMLAVLLTASARLNNADVVDPYLHYLDHHSTNIYIPEKIDDFMRPSIPNGVNVTLSVGAEHGLGIFTVDDFRAAFEKYCSPVLQKLDSGTSEDEQVAAMLACLVRPDRVFWTIFQPSVPCVP